MLEIRMAWQPCL